jgi:hypothetical protein
MILGENAISVIEQLQAANEAQSVALKALLAYMKGGGRDRAQIKELTRPMSQAHDRMTALYTQLQHLRLDR